MRKIIQLIFFLLSLTYANTIMAQSLRAYIKAANKAYKVGDYGTALSFYKVAIDAGTNNSNYIWHYAECNRHIYDYVEAERFYARLLGNTKKAKKYPLLLFYYATVLKYNSHYSESAKHFQAFITKQSNQTDDFFVKKAQQEILAIQNIQNFIKPNPDFKVSFCNRQDVNSITESYSDFAAHWVGNDIYYSSGRYFKGDSSVISQIAKTPNNKILARINALDKHTANSCTDSSLTRIVFTRCEGKGDSIRCDLWTADGDGKGNWSNIRKLPSPLNLKKYTTTMPCIAQSNDPNWFKLYFSSNRRGGKGGMDIWSCDLSKDGESFQNIENLGEPINTLGNEVTPFFHDKLYFSSDWHQGLGGYDVFVYDSNRISNLRPPINTSANDVYFNVKPSAEKGFLASNRRPKEADRPQSTNSQVHACCYDIYEWEATSNSRLYPPEEPDSTPYIASTPIPHSIPPLIDTNTIEIPKPNPLLDPSELLPITLYFHNDEPDSNSVSLNTTTIYEDTYEKYFALKETYKVAYGANLPAGELYGARQSVEHFFQDEVKQGYEDLEEFTQRLLAHLEAGEQIEVGIEGYTSPRAASNYNDALSSRRIASVENHFDAFQFGVLKPFLTSKQLVIKRVPYGESRVPKGVNADYKNTRLSIYSPAAAAERRVKIISIKLK